LPRRFGENIDPPGGSARRTVIYTVVHVLRRLRGGLPTRFPRRGDPPPPRREKTTRKSAAALPEGNAVAESVAPWEKASRTVAESVARRCPNATPTQRAGPGGGASFDRL